MGRVVDALRGHLEHKTCLKGQRPPSQCSTTFSERYVPNLVGLVTNIKPLLFQGIQKKPLE